MDKSRATPVTRYLSEYTKPDIHISALDLRFDLDLDNTLVVATMDIERSHPGSSTPVVFDGDELVLESLSLDGELMKSADYALVDGNLVFKCLPDRGRLQIETRISPAANTALMGLYASSGNYCTQCEAEGFRRMTFFPDRPDVLTTFTCTLVADPQNCPVLLSNGNLVDEGKLSDGRHYATWHDPWPKPSYLFALVAGDLAWIEDRFVTMGGREVTLRLYVEAHNVDKCDHAMAALIKSMRWDEEVYDREYDLDVYNIVAVDDFNMGAMENKSLNVFNSKYVLASPDTATDTDYQNIEGVIAHEYFHNWSGNRVTCRDWFQLSLKEGFTVFRDQEFSADTFSRGVKRIEDVNILRTHQFREDAGPMAHPVRPDSYVEINNFYTATVYNKGAEVVRMLHTLLGEKRFLAGTSLYFDRHDGEAVTIEDFICALEDVNDIRFEQFRLWYSQAGTPRIEIARRYDAKTRSLKFEITQSCPDTPGQSAKAPFHIPLRMALITTQGKRKKLDLADGDASPGVDDGELVLNLTKAKQQFRFDDVDASDVPSLLRGFSAPVMLNADLKHDELSFLMVNDDDPFSRWEAGQVLATQVLGDLVEQHQGGARMSVPSSYLRAYREALNADIADLNFKAEALRIPSEIVLAETLGIGARGKRTTDPSAIHMARRHLLGSLAADNIDTLKDLYDRHASDGVFSPDPESAGRRSLANLCLGMLAATDEAEAERLCLEQFENANNMTDELAAMTSIAHSNWASRERVTKAFLGRWKNQSLVVDKWLRTLATSPAEDTVSRVQALTSHPVYSETNPNKVYSLIGGFSVGNPSRFHAADGSGYRFLGEYVRRLDAINPQVAARMMGAFTTWRRYDTDRQRKMREQLELILAKPGLSSDVFEIASKSLSS